MNIYKESNLSNGLKIITSEAPNLEVVDISVWVRAGSRYESKEQLGYAHILEHMMMKGSKGFPLILKLSMAMDRVGASSNAITGQERIFFYIQVSKQHFNKMLKLLADIIIFPILEADVLENEKKVIIQELAKANENYPKRLWEVSMKNIFRDHPLSQSVLGSEKSIISSTVDALNNYHKRFFTIDRSAIIINGGISHEEVLSQINGLFDDQEKKGFVDETHLLNIKAGLFFEEAPIKQTHIAASYVMPRISFKEGVAFEIIANYLGYGKSAFLKQILRHKLGLIYNISVSNNSFQDANLFYIETVGTKPKEIVSQIMDVIEGFEKYFTEQIFEEIKEQAISVFVRKLNADLLGELAYLGNGWKIYGRLIFPEEFIQEIKNISYKDILDIKDRYLTKNNLCIVAIGEQNPF